MLDSWDDDELLAALGEAMRARRAVPDWFVEMGKNAYGWHNIDAELAQLTYDSSRDQDTVAAVRSEAASIRALTFTSARLSIELEVGQGSLLGQIIPPRAGTLEVHTTAGVTSSPVDEIGCFVVDPIPSSPFRLRCRTEDGADVLTGWITLLSPVILIPVVPRLRRHPGRPGRSRWPAGPDRRWSRAGR